VRPATLARSAAAVVALPLLLVLSACTPTSALSASWRLAAPPVELARFYDQELLFGPCAGHATPGADDQLVASDPRFGCARLEVPLDYTDPGGVTARIAVLRVPARGDAVGSLLLHPGGPGASGIAFATALAPSPITERFDLVGFAPRGVGASAPAVDCSPDEESRAGWSELLGAAGPLTEDGARGPVERCARGSGGEEALATIATRDTVRDVDVLRAALGDRQLTFLGQGHGTRVGALYAAEHPQRVRAMVLDGAIDPRPGPVERRLAGVPPTLVVSVTGDPTTPHDAGIRLAAVLGGSLLTVEGAQHTVVAAGTSACVTDIVAAYLVDLRTPPPGTRCAL
jgi:hypothetical protein